MVFFFSLHLSNIFPSPKSKNFFPVTKKEKSLFVFPKTKNLFPRLPSKKKQRKQLFLSHMNKNVYCPSPKKISFPVSQKEKFLFLSPKYKNLFSHPPRIKIFMFPLITSQISFPVSLEQKPLSLSHKKKNSFPVSQE